MKKKPIVQYRNVKTYFKTFNGLVKAVDDISFDVYPGEILAIVGESGSGKSVAMRNLLGLNRSVNTVVEGSITLNNGKPLDLTALGDKEWRSVRGRQIGMIFQEPMSSFDPLSTVGDQAVEAYRAHFKVSAAEAREVLVEMFRKVHIPEAERRFDEYPHEMSGGMLQRIMIATVLAVKPAVLIADEPTTALDVTIQAQILNLMKELQSEFGTSIIFITHDLGVVRQIADRVIVMYSGKITEEADADSLFDNSSHPYTMGLLDSRVLPEFKGGSLPAIPGIVPRPFDLPEGCRFNPRCSRAMEKCRRQLPPTVQIAKGHFSTCWLHSEDSDK